MIGLPVCSSDGLFVGVLLRLFGALVRLVCRLLVCLVIVMFGKVGVLCLVVASVCVHRMLIVWLVDCLRV